MSGRQTNIPAMRISTGSNNERINDASYGHIRYNTDEHYLEIYHSDSNNSTAWRDLITNNKDNIDISGLLVVSDASFNDFLKVPDLSIDIIHALNGNIITLTEDLSINGTLNVSDICVNKIKALNFIISYKNKVNKIYSHYPVLGVEKKGKLFFQEGNTKKVKKISLDDLNLKKKNNYILKIDVDGNEYHVINSAKKFIRKNKPLILIEISKSLISRFEFESIINFLENCNYNIILFKYFKFSPKILKFDPRNLGIDYFFVPKDFKKNN